MKTFTHAQLVNETHCLFLLFFSHISGMKLFELLLFVELIFASWTQNHVAQKSSTV